MATQTHALFLVLTALASYLLPMAAIADEGTATFFTPLYVPSACDGFEEQGVMIAAASDEFWDNGGACGSWYRVKCIGATNQGNPDPCNGDNSVVVKIVDYCPSGCQGTIDLSQEAFALIADPAAGKIQVEYDSI